MFFDFHPELWGFMIQFDKYFSVGLKPPTSSVFVFFFDFYREVLKAPFCEISPRTFFHWQRRSKSTVI